MQKCNLLRKIEKTFPLFGKIDVLFGEIHWYEDFFKAHFPQIWLFTIITFLEACSFQKNMSLKTLVKRWVTTYDLETHF